MSKHMPPVPPAGRSDKGPNPSPSSEAQARQVPAEQLADENLAEKGHQGNIKQNTTNVGYQQDR